MQRVEVETLLCVVRLMIDAWYTVDHAFNDFIVVTDNAYTLLHHILCVLYIIYMPFVE